MIYEDEILKITYNECDKKYINKLIKILKDRIPSILDFFKIKYFNKVNIILYENLEEYRDNLIESFKIEAKINGGTVREYQNFMIANTEDGNINMQSLDLVKKLKLYKSYTEEELCYNACHEFTHLCQQNIGSISPSWFWEVIATSIGNPECQHEITNKFSLEDLMK